MEKPRFSLQKIMENPWKNKGICLKNSAFWMMMACCLVFCGVFVLGALPVLVYCPGPAVCLSHEGHTDHENSLDRPGVVFLSSLFGFYLSFV